MESYRVRLSRPDGTEAWLGEAGSGPTDDPEKSPLCDKEEAEYVAAERNLFHGRSGWRYWIVPA